MRFVNTKCFPDFGSIFLLFHVTGTLPWYADIVNYLVLGDLPTFISKSRKLKIKSEAKYYVWDDPYLWKFCSDQVVRGVYLKMNLSLFLFFVTILHVEVILDSKELLERF